MTPEIEPRANTPILGLPYPAATDPVAQGAAAIQALATALDNGKLQRHAYTARHHMESGVVAFGTVATNVKASSSVTFTSAFPGGPNIVTGAVNASDPNGANTPGPCPAHAWVMYISGAAFTLWAVNASNTNPSTLYGYWSAEGPD
jgi:hypothetical protein